MAQNFPVLAGGVVLVLLYMGVLAFTPADVGPPQNKTQSPMTPHINATNISSIAAIYDKNPDNSSLYLRLEPNVSSQMFLSGWPIKVRTNRYGLRDEDVRMAERPDTTRILVIGDSYTFGVGVNESERYTEVAERKLNREIQRDIQIINAGITGWGMKDYYLFLKEVGIAFQPDIIVVSVVGNDYIGREKHDSIVRRSRTRSEAREKQRAYLERNPPNQTGLRYITAIERLGREKEIPAHYFVLSSLFPKERRYLETVTGRWDKQLHFAPGKTRNSTNRYTFYKNRHPNVLGHREIGRKLSSLIKNQIGGNVVSRPSE